MLKEIILKRMQLLEDRKRLNSNDYIVDIFPDFIEFHGDRLFGDDSSIIAGIASLEKWSVTVIGQMRGKSLEEKIKYNFSMCYPEGYRKALRLMKQAEKFNRPIICFVDTLGAYPGVEAEERGQSIAIANNLMEMQRLKVPIISIIIGNGGSGGALAFLVANQIAMLENSLFSVISPKACANILWKDTKRQLEAAQLLKITAEEIKALELIDTIIAEPTSPIGVDYKRVSDNIKEYIVKTLKEYEFMTNEQLVNERLFKYRKIGQNLE